MLVNVSECYSSTLFWASSLISLHFFHSVIIGAYQDIVNEQLLLFLLFSVSMILHFFGIIYPFESLLRARKFFQEKHNYTHKVSL
jgi:uncharacterized membrane protein